MLLYRPKQKISTTASEEVKFPASSIDGLATVATSGSYNDLTDKPEVPGVPDIVQTTGTSTTAVMSQKAVTDELNKKAPAHLNYIVRMADIAELYSDTLSGFAVSECERYELEVNN